jgi:hypothetical protein
VGNQIAAEFDALVHCHFSAKPCVFLILDLLVSSTEFAAGGMARVTIALDDADHLAMKLLALQQKTAMTSLLQEAIKEYLDRRGGYDLVIQFNSN